MLIISYKKIFVIIITSTFLGLITNYFNPKGIPLIRAQQEIKWAADSLFIHPDKDSTVSLIDKNNSETFSAEESDSKSKPKTKNINSTSSKKLIKESQKEDEKKSEVVAFEEPSAIKLEQAYSLYNKEILFIDARDEGDFDAGHITNSVNIPFDDFENHKHKLEKISKEKPIVIYCAGTECDLSHLLANLLFEKGYKQVYVFFGGWTEWFDAKYPTEQTQGSD